MTTSDKNNEAGGIPVIIFIPVLLCIIGIVFLLDLRRQRVAQQTQPTYNNHDQDLAQHEELLNEFDDDQDLDQEDDDNAGEGSSTAVRVKKVGKKRGEKLRRKEQMRQYREYMDQQRELRRAQEEIYEAEFQRKKMEESMKRTDELERRRKEKEKKLKAEEKEELKRVKSEEKDAKKRQARFDKYAEKLTKIVKEKKLNQINELAKQIGLSEPEVIEILHQLCEKNNEFELSLWSGNKDTFLSITKADYDQFKQDLKIKGKMSIHNAAI